MARVYGEVGELWALFGGGWGSLVELLTQFGWGLGRVGMLVLILVYVVLLSFELALLLESLLLCRKDWLDFLRATGLRLVGVFHLKFFSWPLFRETFLLRMIG